MEQQLRDLVNGALKECFEREDASFALEHPKELSHGDYATNVALLVSKQLGKSPKEIAEILVEQMKGSSPVIHSITIAGPGFINFTLSPDYIVDQVKTILEIKEKWGNLTLFNNKKILVEHSSPNLFKPFHIGHLMNNTIGEAITRLARYSGAKVETMSFPSDISLGIAKAIFIILEKLNQDGTYKWDDIVVLGNAYVEGVKRYDEDLSIHSRVKQIADNLYSQTPSDEWDLFIKCKAVNMSYFEQVVARLGSKFDQYIYESEAGIIGKNIVEDNTPKIFTESEGAIVYIPNETDKHLNTAVFINSQGNPTYEAKDIGLLSMKFDPKAKHSHPDLSIFITDAQQVSHFQVVLDAAKKIHTEWVEKSLHKYHGRMSFKGQKMSSRLGGVPLAVEMIDAVADEVKEHSSELDEKTREQIAISAIKFSILRVQAGKDINFDPETSLSFEGDSGPYLQYTAVRAQSVIDKAKKMGFEPLFVTAPVVTDLERLLIRFPAAVDRALQEWAPHHIVGYLLDVAQAFNSWYGNTQIINENNSETPHRLAIAAATVQTLKNGLYLLGIEVPEKM